MKITKPGEAEREVFVVPVEEPLYTPVEAPTPISTNTYSKTVK